MPAEGRRNKRLALSTNRKQLFETANYLLCQLALQIQELERINAHVSDGRQPEQSEQPAQAEEEAPQ